MTYCVAMNLSAGMIFASDSRTNAGVDQVSKFGKMNVFSHDNDRVIVTLSSGNLSITQSTINLVEQRSRAPDGLSNIWKAMSLFDVATYIGDALRAVLKRDGPYLQQDNIDSGASFIVGGQIAGEHQRLFTVYAQGNFIESTEETPYFQIGEVKYGKPILDRVIKPDSSLVDAAKCTLVSFDSTMRSNISVGLPIDILVYERDTLRIALRRRIVEGDEYFEMVHRQWGEGLRRVFADLPSPNWIDNKS